MNQQYKTIAAVAALAGLAVVWSRNASAAVPAPEGMGLIGYVFGPVSGWQMPEPLKPWAGEFAAAEDANGMPRNLLARVAWQESRGRADIIGCKLHSSAGAQGIMQIIPRWHPDVNPCDPVASIHYAGRYLRRLYDRFGSWEMALAAYNWGQGNLSSKGFDSAPKETRDYVAQIGGDILQGGSFA